MKTTSNKFSLAVLLVIALVSIFTGVFQLNDVTQKKESLVNWDGYGYYLHLPSVFIYHDAQDYQLVHAAARDYKINTGYQTRALNDSVEYPVYPIGQAVTWLPFFGAAHLIATQSSYVADGFSAPYQCGVFVSSILFILLGFYFNRKLLLHFLSDKVVALSMFIIYFGTNYFYYSHFEISLTHVYLYGYLSLMLYSLYQYHKKQKSKYLLIAILCFSIAVLSRNSEIFWILIPVLLGFVINKIFTKSQLLAQSKTAFLFAASAILAYVIFQLSYYKLSTGLWFVDGYRDHTFNFLHPNIKNCLFGFYKGWFVYTPLAILFFTGFYFLFKKNKTWFYSVFVYSLLYLYLLISWDDWTYGSTFGFRPVVQCYAIFILPLGYCLEFLLEKIKWVSLIIIGILVSIQLLQMNQFVNSIFLKEKYGFNYYKRVFLKLTLDPHDRIVIDVPTHEFSLEPNKIKTILQLDSLDFSSNNNSQPQQIFKFSTDQTIRLNTRLDYSYFGDSYGYWNQSKIIIQKKGNSKTPYWTGLRLPEIMRNKARDTITYNQIIECDKGDTILGSLEHSVPDNLFIHNIQVDLIEN